MEKETNIYGKLHKAKRQIGTVKKNAKNPHFKNTYADLNALIDAVEPILLENDLILLQPLENGKVYTRIVDVNTSEILESCIDLPASGTPQAMGSAITYYRRYTLQSLLSLQAEDDDGTRASTPTPPTKEVLSIGSSKFIACKTALIEGKGTIEQIKGKYEVSKEVEQALIK